MYPILKGPRAFKCCSEPNSEVNKEQHNDVTFKSTLIINTKGLCSFFISEKHGRRKTLNKPDFTDTNRQHKVFLSKKGKNFQ